MEEIDSMYKLAFENPEFVKFLSEIDEYESVYGGSTIDYESREANHEYEHDISFPLLAVSGPNLGVAEIYLVHLLLVHPVFCRLAVNKQGGGRLPCVGSEDKQWRVGITYLMAAKKRPIGE